MISDTIKIATHVYQAMVDEAATATKESRQLREVVDNLQTIIALRKHEHEATIHQLVKCQMELEQTRKNIIAVKQDNESLRAAAGFRAMDRAEQERVATTAEKTSAKVQFRTIVVNS